MKEYVDFFNELLRKLLFLPEQASTFAGRVDRLHYFVVIVTMISSLLFQVRERALESANVSDVMFWPKTIVAGSLAPRKSARPRCASASSLSLSREVAKCPPWLALV